jgi:hypothetical protein
MDAQQNQSLFAIAACLRERQSARLLRIRACVRSGTVPALQEMPICHAMCTYSKKREYDEICAIVRL